MACTRHKVIIRQGDEYAFTSRSYVESTGESSDYSAFTGEVHFIQGDVTIYTYALDLTFVDISSNNVAFTLSTVNTAAMAVGTYDVVLRIEATPSTIYLPSPNKGSLIYEIEAAL